MDKLLTPGGWLLFDDLDWTYASSPTLAWAPSNLGLPDDEYRTAQVGEVFDLLVRQHPNYGECHRMGRWGWARKLPCDADMLDLSWARIDALRRRAVEDVGDADELKLVG